MKKLISLSMLAGILALGATSSVAQAEERERCTTVRKCHWDDGRRRCERERVCRMVHIDRDRDHGRDRDRDRR